jgi:hypothetical protein
MFNGRIYRAATLPVLAAFAVAALSLVDRPAPLSSAPAPELFDGGWAMQELSTLSREFPQRQPGSRADDQLARRVAQLIGEFGGQAGGGFRVSVRRFRGQTLDGSRSLSTVIAARAGTTSRSAIVVLAHRDAAAAGSEAALSGTAVLLGLARALANHESNRTIVLVSTSGGSGGDAGASNFATLVQSGHVPWLTGSGSPPATAGAESGGEAGAENGPSGEAGASSESGAGRPIDGALVLGDLASEGAGTPVVLPYSSDLGAAPTQLAETAAAAIRQQLGIPASSPSLVDQLAHLAVPLTVGEQGALNAAGVPAVLMQASAERGPSRSAPVSAARLEALGSAALSSVEALDAAPDISSGSQADLVLSRMVIPGGTIRLVVGALLLPALLVVVDALARVRRRREAVGRWIGLTLACGVPFLVAVAIVGAMGALGLAGPTPGPMASPGATHVGVPALATLALAILVLAACWLYWSKLVGALGVATRPYPPAAGVALLAVLDIVAVLTWLVNPFAALLLVPAVHLWMLLAAPNLRPSRGWIRLALVLLGVCAPALIVVYYLQQLSGGIAGSLWSVLLLAAGDHIGAGTVVLWSASLGCLVAVSMLAREGRAVARRSEQLRAIAVPGALTYATPGSLAGTETALGGWARRSQDA